MVYTEGLKGFPYTCSRPNYVPYTFIHGPWGFTLQEPSYTVFGSGGHIFGLRA